MKITSSLTRAWALLVVGLALLLSCSEKQPSEVPAAGGAAGAAPVAPTLRFDVERMGNDPPTLELEPQQDAQLTVIVSPPDVYRVRFSILELAANSAPIDASLNRTDVNTDDEGQASIILHAPSRQSTFELRASLGTLASTSLEVRVREKSFGELEVVPDYDGRRPIDEWFTVAYPSEICENLKRPTSLADTNCDGVNEPCSTGRPGAALRIQDIWAGPTYAVTLGAGNHVWGCAQGVGIAANELTSVTVPVSNVLISLDEEPLMAVLGINGTLPPWVEHLNGAIDSAMDAFTDDAENDLALVLDLMASKIDNPTLRAGFEDRRVEHAWEQLAVSALAIEDGFLLRNRLRSWMVSGADDLQSDEALIGRIDPVGGVFQFTVTEVSGIDAEVAGFARPSGEPTTWTAENDDTLVFATEVSWAPSKLVVALGEAEALSEYGSQSDLVGALGELLDCNVLSNALLNSNELGLYPGCTVDCGVDLCTGALGALVERAREALVEPQKLEVSAAGVAVVDELARPASFEGTWLGSFPGGDPVVSGTIVGAPTGPAD